MYRGRMQTFDIEHILICMYMYYIYGEKIKVNLEVRAALCSGENFPTNQKRSHPPRRGKCTMTINFQYHWLGCQRKMRGTVTLTGGTATSQACQRILF